MNQSDIPARTSLSELIPHWEQLTLLARAKIEVEFNAEWWRGYHAGREAESNEAPGTDSQLSKAIQIAVASASKHTFEALYALCADVSIWYMVSPTYRDSDRGWILLPSIPLEKIDG